MAELEEGKNPLLNELVIDNISKYLSFEELKVCRGLNHLWKKTTSRTFLKLCHRLTLHSHKDNFIRSNEEMTMTQFMEIYSDPNHSHPRAQLLRQYRNFYVTYLAKECIPEFYNFMVKVGPQMTSLGLINVEVFRNLQDLVDIVSSEYTPNLEELSLCHLHEIDNYASDKIVNYLDNVKPLRIRGKENKHLRRFSFNFNSDNKFQWLDVLSRYPKLKVLSLIQLPANVLEEIATGLVTIRKADETKLKLTDLEISRVDYTGDTEVENKAGWRRIEELLKNANLPLEKMSLDGSICSALIQHYGENLKKLVLKNRIPQPLPLPLMNALEKISVEYCRDLTFLTKVPNLKTLYFDSPPRSRQVRFPESSLCPLMSLTKLSSGRWKKWKVTEMEQLLLWMPNVQNLDICNLNNATFSLICQHLPNLKELTVHEADLDDSGVVGDFNGALEVEGCRPNITNLKELETFEMVNLEASNYGLTEKSVYHGFALMPKLSNLTIYVKSELRSDAMLALNRGIENVRVMVINKLRRR